MILVWRNFKITLIVESESKPNLLLLYFAVEQKIWFARFIFLLNIIYFYLRIEYLFI